MSAAQPLGRQAAKTLPLKRADHADRMYNACARAYNELAYIIQHRTVRDITETQEKLDAVSAAMVSLEADPLPRGIDEIVHWAVECHECEHADGWEALAADGLGRDVTREERQLFALLADVLVEYGREDDQ